MIASNALSAPEALVLTTLPRFDVRKAIKVGLFALLLQGVLRMEVEQKQGLMRKRQTIRLHLAATAPRPPSAVSQSLIAVVQAAAARDGLMAEIVKQATRVYGRTLVKFVQEVVGPTLVKQGLAESRRYRFLGLFPMTRFYPTAAGEAEKSRIQDTMRQAGRIPEFLRTDPAQAAAIAAAAGSAILLVDGLRPHYQALSQAMRPPSTGDSSGYYDVGSTGSSDGGLDLGTLDTAAGFDFAACDFSAFDSFDAGFDAFDAGFDAACDAGGGDGGGDGGGGSGC